MSGVIKLAEALKENQSLVELKYAPSQRPSLLAIFGMLAAPNIGHIDVRLLLSFCVCCSLASNKRHELLSHLVQLLDQTEIHPDSEFEPPSDQCASIVAWRRDGKRIGLRCAQMQWASLAPGRQPGILDVTASGRWVVRFPNVPNPTTPAPFDELYLALCSPEALHVFRHDGSYGMSTAGRRLANQFSSRGKQIQIYSSQSVRGWRAALELYILPKLWTSDCESLGTLAFDDRRAVELAASFKESGYSKVAATYANVPLGHRSPSSRKAVLEQVVRAIDAELYPGASFERGATVTADSPRPDSSREEGDLGPDLAKWQRQCSWLRTVGSRDVRVTCKSAQLGWDTRSKKWRFTFQGIRSRGAAPAPALASAPAPAMAPEPEDTCELYLALYTPKGLYVYLHDGQVGLTGAGRLEAISGKQIKLAGPVHEENWERALAASILPKLDDEESGCRRVAFVDFSL